jgi:tetratricopeptide (TPR) repeat protein
VIKPPTIPSNKRPGLLLRFSASWTLEKAFNQAANGEFAKALEFTRRAIETSQDRFLEARLIEGHCHWCLGDTAEAIKAFARAREMMEKAKRLASHDRDYLLRYAMVHFKSRPDISPFRDMEVPDAPSLERVMKRFKIQFPMS